MKKKQRRAAQMAILLVMCAALLLAYQQPAHAALKQQTKGNALATHGLGWKTSTTGHIYLIDSYDGALLGEDQLTLRCTDTSSTSMYDLVYKSNLASVPESYAIAHAEGLPIFGRNLTGQTAAQKREVLKATLPFLDVLEMESAYPIYVGIGTSIVIPKGYVPTLPNYSLRNPADNVVYNRAVFNVYYDSSGMAPSAQDTELDATFMANIYAIGELRVNLDGTYYRMYDTSTRLSVDPNRTTVRYDACGGTLAEGTRPETVIYNHTDSLAVSDPTREGYLFAGWNTEPDGSGKQVEEGALKTLFPEEKQVILYAQWREGGFSITEGETEVRGARRVDFRPDAEGRASLDAQLAHGQSLSVFGLESGSRYRIREEGNKLYKPRFEVTRGAGSAITAEDEAGRGKSLSSPEEALAEDRDYVFTNVKDRTSDGMRLTVKKRVVPADADAVFAFRYYVEGLDPDYTYAVSVNGEREALAPDPDGGLQGSVRLKDGESFYLDGLPEGARYGICEVSRKTGSEEFPYQVRYQVVRGEETVVSGTASGERDLPEGFSAAKGLASGEGSSVASPGGIPLETIAQDSDVEYLFTNSQEPPHDLTIVKRVDGSAGSAAEGEAYAFRLRLEGLTPGKVYASSESEEAVQAGADGSAEMSFSLRAGERMMLIGLDGTVRYTLTEAAGKYSAKAQIQESPDGTVLGTAEAGSRERLVISNDMDLESGPDGDAEDGEAAGAIGFGQDQTVTVTNQYEPLHSLTVTKKVTGQDLSEEQKQAHFSAEAAFTGLEPGTEYRVLRFGRGDSAGEEEDDQTQEESTFQTSGDGTAAVSMDLEDGVSYLFPDLPDGCTYRIGEEACPSVAATVRWDEEERSPVAGKESGGVQTESVTMDGNESVLVENEYRSPKKMVLPVFGGTGRAGVAAVLLLALLTAVLFLRKKKVNCRTD